MKKAIIFLKFIWKITCRYAKRTRLREFYGAHNRPSQQLLRRTVNKFGTTYSLKEAQVLIQRRHVRTEKKILPL